MLLRGKASFCGLISLCILSVSAFAQEPTPTPTPTPTPSSSASGGNGTRGGGNGIPCVLSSKIDGKQHEYEAVGTDQRDILDQDIVEVCAPISCEWAYCKLNNSMYRIYDFVRGEICEENVQ